MITRLALALALVVAAPGQRVALAQPTVHVRAESRIELRTVRRDRGTEIQGTLRDDLGAPLSARSLTVRVRQRAPSAVPVVESVTTDSEGRFGLSVRLELGTYLLSAAFEGDPGHERVEVERQLDLTRADVRLRVSVPEGGRLALDIPTHTIEVSAHSPAGGDGLEIDMLDELDRIVAHAVTDANGTVRFTLASSALGPPGAGRLKARSSADARRAEAQTEVPIVRIRQTTLALTAARLVSAPNEPLGFSGTLRDSAGPIEGAAVGLFGDDEHLATVLTDASGAFHADVRVPEAPSGRLSVVARFISDSPGRSPTQSEAVVLRVAARAKIDWLFSLVPIVLTLVLLVAASRRAPTRGDRPPPNEPKRAPGVVPTARRGLRADHVDLGGVVCDQRDEEPVPNARLTLRENGASIASIHADGSGRFSFAGARQGTFSLRIEARGYAPVEVQIEIPHRGEWSDVQVRLESFRARALAPFHAVALEVLPAGRLWDVWTNRDVLAQAKPRTVDGDALFVLTSQVEEACYGSEAPTEERVDEIEVRASRALGDLRKPREPKAPRE